MNNLYEFSQSFKMSESIPLDSRTVVKAYTDISNIVNPSVGFISFPFLIV